MVNVLITGSTGFIGSRFVEKYSKKYTFFPVVREKSKIEKILKFIPHKNIIFFDEKSALDDFKKNPCDILIHLASNATIDVHFEDIEPLIESNVIYASQVFDAFARAGGKKILNVGTWWQYYPTNCLYTATKQFCENLLVYYSTQYEISHLTLRLFDTYGPNDPRPKIFNLILDAAKNEKGLDLTGGMQLVNLTHVDDICEGFSRAIELFEKKTAVDKSYALKHPETWILRKAIELFVELHGLDVNLNWGKRRYSPRDCFEIPPETILMPDWSPQWTVRDGLASIISD